MWISLVDGSSFISSGLLSAVKLIQKGIPFSAFDLNVRKWKWYFMLLAIHYIRSLTIVPSSASSKSSSRSDLGDETDVKLLLLDAFKASEIDVDISK